MSIESRKSFSSTEVKNMKREAKRQVRASGVGHNEALNKLAVNNGFRNWSLLVKHAGKQPAVRPSEPPRLLVTSVPASTAVTLAAIPTLTASSDPILVPRVASQQIAVPPSEPKAKAAKKAAEPKRRLLSITRVGSEYGLTAAKAKKVLVANGLMDDVGQPTGKAIAAKLFEVRKTEDRYGHGGEVEYFVWDVEALSQFFTKPDALTKFSFVRNRHQAESKFCEVFRMAGKALGVMFDVPDELYDEQKKKNKQSSLSGAARAAIEQCEFLDPDFIGGPGALIDADSRKKVEAVFTAADPVVQEIYAALKPADPAAADFFLGAIENLHRWMLKAAR